MALSGTFYTNVNSHWRLQGEWSASQSISGNYSNVTLKVYWMGLDSYGDTYTTATKYGSSTINGSSDSYSFSAKLTNAEKKLIQTHTVKVNHNSDGTKSISLSAYADINLTLSGTYYGRVSISDSITLNTIPRASSITSSANFTAGNNLYISVSRANSGFTHIARVYVNGVNVYSTSSSSKFGTSVTASINHTQVFNQLNGGSTQDVRVEVDTYSGSTLIGKTGDSGMPPDKTGTVTAPSASTCDLTNTIANGTTVYFDQTITLSISRANSGFTHTVRFKDSNSGAVIKEFTGVGTSLSWTPNATEQAHIYNKIPTANELDGQVDVITYYSGEIVRSATSHDIEYRLRNQNPTFGTGNISYTDANSATSTITGDASYIVQNKSTLRVNLVSLATPKYGATISRYDISVAGKTDSLTAVGYKDMGTISSSSNVALKVEAVDSRGNRTPATITVKMLPWSPPVANVTAKRLNNFEDSTTVTLNGSISPVTIGTTQKNKLKSATYKYKLTTASTYPTPTSYGTMPTTSSYSFADKTLTLNNIYSYHVQIVVEDQFGSTTITKTVSTGQPIMFMDSSKKSVGINRFPENSGVLEVQDAMYFYPPTTATTKIGTIFSSNTYKTYIHFKAGSGSNDPAFIMHETGSDTANNNRGVLHLCPSDDLDSVNDYVTIHGTNDAENLRLYTSGDAYFGGTISFPANRYASSYGGAINLNNSDIVGLNQLFMSDPATSDSEGIQWAKSGTPSGSTDPALYDSFRILNGVAYINSEPMNVPPNASTLWSGAIYMNDAQTATPTKRLSECANGWILCWSDYNADTATTADSDMVLSFIHKKHVANFSGKWMPFAVPNYTTGIVVKYLGVYDDRLTGHANNDSGTTNGSIANPNDVVLRRIWEW